MMAGMTPSLLAFTTAMVASVALTVPVRLLALRVGMVDYPGPRKVHLQPIPLLGGIAIYLGVLLGMLVSSGGQAITQILGILTGATLVILVGTLDDRGLLHHQIKLFVGMPVAGLILFASGIHAQVFSMLFPGQRGAAADAVLTVFWVTGITASFSIFDYMDGLCTGIAAIASFFFAVFATLSGQVLVSTLAAAVMGAALGFLCWNFNPAKIFMGDGGAMFLGFLMATLSLKLRMTGTSRTADWLVPIFVLGVPIFDTALVSISRSRRGLLPFATPGKDHTGHRLANCGLGTRRAVLTIYVLGVGFGTLALLVSRLASGLALKVAAASAVVALLAILLLEKTPYERQGVKPPV
jgi:UDP-GlcNAc:undecaprenyl-phosphate/decaprenyl-phosphate GlcNAc-1-phosphate transferase